MINEKLSLTPFIYRRQILEGELDSLGHLNNAAYLQILEEARWEQITQGGYGLAEVQQSRISPVILEIAIKFRKEIKNREWVRIESTCIEMKGELRLLIQQRIFKEDSGKLAAEAIFEMATLHLDKRKLVIPPSAFLQALGIVNNQK